jgi:branched-chain amino acid transport system permease protein
VKRDTSFITHPLIQKDSEILRISGITKSFGELTALDDVSLSVMEGSIHGLIGPNGSGKTTLVNTVSSTYTPNAGQIFFRDRDITFLSPYKIAKLGIGRTFQNISIYPDLTVLDNILIGFHNAQQTGTFSRAFDLSRARRDEKRMREQATSLATLVGLEEHLLTPAATLGHNQKRFLEIARALGLKPALILLDEPGAGLSGEELLFLQKLIARIKDMGISVLLIEHHVEFVINVSDVITVLNHGVQIANGSPAEIVKNQDVIEAYLGIREGSDA